VVNAGDEQAQCYGSPVKGGQSTIHRNVSASALFRAYQRIDIVANAQNKGQCKQTCYAQRNGRLHHVSGVA